MRATDWLVNSTHTPPRQRGMWRLGVAAVLCVGLTVAAVASGDDDDDEPKGDQPMATEAMPANWDSLYAVIRESMAPVEPILRRGCYDCHTDKTEYPWYHSIPVVKGWINGHIKHARKELDLTAGFPFKGHERPADDLISIRNEVLEGHMPPLSYRFMHWSAKPSGPARDSLISWIDTSLRLLAAHGQYPLGQPELVPQDGAPAGD